MGRHRMTWDKTAARAPSGLYGFTKKTQSDCEASIRKLNRTASSLIKSAYKKDKRVADFLRTHAKRSKSSSARVLLAALKREGEALAALGGKLAASRTPGLYGYPSNTVKLGLAICASVREEAGLIAAGLHTRRAKRHARITNFFKEHSKQARCYSSRMLLAGYPDPAKTATDKSASEGSWLDWDMGLGDDTEHYG